MSGWPNRFPQSTSQPLYYSQRNQPAAPPLTSIIRNPDYSRHHHSSAVKNNMSESSYPIKSTVSRDNQLSLQTVLFTATIVVHLNTKTNWSSSSYRQPAAAKSSLPDSSWLIPKLSHHRPIYYSPSQVTSLVNEYDSQPFKFSHGYSSLLSLQPPPPPS